MPRIQFVYTVFVETIKFGFNDVINKLGFGYALLYKYYQTMKSILQMRITHAL